MLTTIREEQLLAKFAGEDVAVPQPCTRTEKFLAKMAGLDVQTPTPITREEQILNKIAEGGGGGGDSDFSTAEVTIVNNGNMATTLHIPNADELTGTPFSPSCVSDAYIPIGETITIKAVLYKGRVMTPMLPNIEATGNVTIDNSMLIISGDCTITIS